MVKIQQCIYVLGRYIYVHNAMPPLSKPLFYAIIEFYRPKKMILMNKRLSIGIKDYIKFYYQVIHILNIKVNETRN